MKYQTAKELLLSEGFRIVSEDFEDDVAYEDVVDTNTEAMPDEGGEQLDSDVFGAVEQGLGDEGFDAQEVADIMTANNERIDELSQKGVAAEDIVKILAYENCECEDETTEDVPADDGVEFEDEQFDEAYMTEGKSKPKGDKFSHKEKVAGRKPKGCCGGKKGGKCTDDDDDEINESVNSSLINQIKKVLIGRGYNADSASAWINANWGDIVILNKTGSDAEEIVYEIDGSLDEAITPDNGWAESNKKYGSISELYDVLIGRGYNLKSAKSWVDANMDKIVMLKRKGYSAEEIVYELDGSLEESIEDVPGLTRGPRGQVGTDNWDDFKDDFRAKTLFLKKSLTPQFVSGIIKDTDFEVDDKEIKAYAFKVIDEVFGTKNPVKNLQARIRSHFVK